VLRSAILLPAFAGLDIIQAIREKYDPLASYIEPHITVVFPFESDLTTSEIQQHLADKLHGLKRFNIRFSEITGDYRDGYLFLNVKKGNDQIIELHDKLYSGLFKKYHFIKVPYIPHLTVGRISHQDAFNQALDKLRDFKSYFEVDIDKVYVERIGDKEESSIEIVHQLE
jgi:2'-5' RNA ligase